MATPKTPRKTCAHTIEGPKIGKHVVAWRDQCKRPVREDQTYCWQHREHHELHQAAHWSKRRPG